MIEKREISLGPLDQVPEGGMQQFEVDGRHVLICRAGVAIHAVNGVCPHRGAQLGSGTLRGTVVVCPWHDWAFDVESGCGLTNPMSNLTTYETSVREGDIIVVIPEE